MSYLSSSSCRQPRAGHLSRPPKPSNQQIGSSSRTYQQRAYRPGDAIAVAGAQLTLEGLLRELYGDLYCLARARTRRLPRWRTLCTAGLVHEAYMRLRRRDLREWPCRAHFLADAKQAMHHIAVEYLRRKYAQKRGGGVEHSDRVSMVADPQWTAREDRYTVLELLHRLDQAHPDAAELVQLRFFCGMTMAEIAAWQSRPLRTVERTWRFARSWLATELTER